MILFYKSPDMPVTNKKLGISKVENLKCVFLNIYIVSCDIAILGFFVLFMKHVTINMRPPTHNHIKLLK